MALFRNLTLLLLASSVCGTSFLPYYNPMHHHEVALQQLSKMKDRSIEADFAKAALRLNVYYECLCPDSIAFITNQLYPTWKKLGQYIDVGFKPFGKASWSWNSDGGWSFTCQHGPKECKGNMYQACLLNIPGTRLSQRVEAVNCIMSNDSPNEATLKCMEQTQIDHPSKSQVNTCANSKEGQQFLHQIGIETKALHPTLSFVPWITFNGEWTQSWQDDAIEDLESTLCKDFLSFTSECKTRQ